MENSTLIPPNINIEQYQKTVDACLKSTSKFGETVYQNVCTGQSFIIPNGFWDYAFEIILLFLGIVFVLMLLGMFIKIWTD